MKIIIAGSRNFDDYFKVQLYMYGFIQIGWDVEIVSGTAKGADQLGERFAKENNYKLKQFPADWNKYGKSAGYIRNEEMAKYADVLIAFWDGESKGTKHMIDLANKHNLIVNVIKP